MTFDVHSFVCGASSACARATFVGHINVTVLPALGELGAHLEMPSTAEYEYPGANRTYL
jgi:hypothetical protein